jgi:hypothetical protein
MALPTPTSLKDADEVGAEVLYGRSATLRVFISSEMRTGRLRRERLAVASVVDKHPDAEPWLWERNARAGRYSSFEVCVGTARTSDILLLILADELTDVTEAEWRAAKDGGANCALFAKRIARRLRQSPRGLRAGLCVGGGRNRPRLEGGGGLHPYHPQPSFEQARESACVPEPRHRGHACRPTARRGVLHEVCVGESPSR